MSEHISARVWVDFKQTIENYAALFSPAVDYALILVALKNIALNWVQRAMYAQAACNALRMG